MKIDVSGYNRTEVLTNFPVLVALSNNLAGFTYSAMNSPSNGADLRFSVDQVNEINYEIDQWNTNGVSTVWVQVPAFQNNLSLYAHWGYSAGQPAYSTNGATWSNNYVAVWHLGEQVTAGQTTGSHTDSTTNANTGTQSKNGWTNGLIGRAQNFDRTATINCGNRASLRPTNISISAWIKPRSINYTTYIEIYRKEDGNDRHLFSFQQDPGSVLAFGIAPGGNYAELQPDALPADYTNGWHQVACTYNGSVKKVYRDGVEIGSAAASGLLATSGTAAGYIGSASGGENFDGLIDQFEISGVGRSSNWVWASYMMVASNQPFLAYSPYATGPVPPSINNQAATNIATTSAWLNGHLSSAGSAPTTVAVYWGTQDGGAPTSGLWQATNTWNEGDWASGSYPTFQATPLTPDTFYYYRCAAWNSAGTNWPTTSANFLAGEVAVTAPDASASESGDTGTFRISRGATATNEPTTVSYRFTGSAALNTDYTLSPAGTSLTLAPGVASTDITVNPLLDRSNTNDTVVTLELLPGNFALGVSSNASVTITNVTPPTTNYFSCLTNGQNKTWSDPTAWTPNGVPTIYDTVTITNQIPWAGGWALTLDAGWAADTINASNTTAGMNSHVLAVGADGAVRVFNVNNNSTYIGGQYQWSQNSATTVSMTEFNNIGSVLGGWWFGGGGNATWSWQNAAQITYFTGIANTLPGHLIFTNATSVNLKRSSTAPNSGVYGSTNMEIIVNTAANGGVSWFIGRADNQPQPWTVSGGGHPVLKVYASQGSAAIQKTGRGNVSMPDVDLFLDGSRDGGISSTGLGNHGGGTAGGIIAANSLTIDATPSAGTRFIGIVEHLLLDGQAGLDAGGAGNGRAFSAVTSNQNLLVQINNIGSVPAIDVGQLEIAANGGEVYVASVGTGTVCLSICNNNRDEHTHIASVAVTANTLNLASANSYLSDRCRWQDIDANANGNLEFRGNFISRGTLTNLWRTDHTTVRAIGGGTNAVQYWECLSQDLGAVSAGFTNNFALARLVLGQSAPGATAKVELALRDQYDNNTADAAPEAVYVTNLTLYGGSILYLNGFNLYYKNTGSWQKAVPGTFAPGDGTGKIRSFLTPPNTVLIMR
jgi:hypothetical protein